MEEEKLEAQDEALRPAERGWGVGRYQICGFSFQQGDPERTRRLDGEKREGDKVSEGTEGAASAGP